MEVDKRYICPNCGGEVKFLFFEGNTDLNKNGTDIHLIVIKEKPGQCIKCGKYFYKNECKTES